MNKFCQTSVIILSRNNLVISRNTQVKYFQSYSTSCSITTKENRSSKSYQSVAEFYSGKSVFITGGTGFLGKVFIEKLLYSCPKLDNIYMLARDKKGENVNKRIENIFNSPVFSRLRKSSPDCLKKVVPVSGDLSLPNLGLSSEDENDLIDNVSVVFHAAATTKMIDPLAVAMKINFEGTQKVLELSQRMKTIEAFVYISSAYAHSQKNVMVETVYPSPAKLEDIYKFIEEYGHDKEETMKFIRERPTTYGFTKALSEAYIADNCGVMPTVIVRPTVVAVAKDEPLKGWVGNWWGATPLLYNVAKGWTRISLGVDSNFVDLVPVDYSSNLSIVAASRAKSNDLQVFHCSSSSDNPITWSDAFKYFNEEMVSRGKNELPYPGVIYLKSRALVNIGTFLLQKTPAHITDLLLKLIGREPKYVKLISQLETLSRTMEFFTTRSWVIKADRARELYNSLSPEDKVQFPCDITQIEWSEYMRDYCKGVLRYLPPKFTT